MTRDLVDPVAGVMELEVGHRAGGAPDRLPVHAADETDQGAGAGEDTQDVVALVVELGAVDGDEADVVGAGIEAEPAELGGVERQLWSGWSRRCGSDLFGCF